MIALSTLSYGLLSLLTKQDLSGYDLMLRIQPFWPAKHSQIYPLLAKLEQEDLIAFESIVQSDKPDKKVYSLTAEGMNTLRKWLKEPACEPAFRDELMFKVYCFALVDLPAAREMIASRLEIYRLRMERYRVKIAEYGYDEVPGTIGDTAPAFGSASFGAYVLLRRAILTSRVDIEWCEWVLSLLADVAPVAAIENAAQEDAKHE